MPQHGIGESLDILALDMGSAIEQRPRLAAEDEVLHGTGAGTPRQPITDEFRYARLADAGLPDQRQRVADDVVGDRHTPDKVLQFENLLAAQDRLWFAHHHGRGSAGDLEFLTEIGILHEDLEHEAVL